VRRLVFALCAVASPCVPTGCSDPYGGRKAVSGEVTLAGAPLAEGTILFAPLDGQGSQANVFVTAGKFTVERKDGLLPGKYLVRVSSADKKTGVDESEAGGPGGSANITFFDLIPADWNVASKQQVTVEADGPNAFKFAVPTAAVPKKSGKR